MEKTKILIFLRVSTETQELDNQKEEMVNYCVNLGYDKEHQIIIEEKGASAIEMNDKYLSLIDEIKQHIKDKDISAVAVWAVNRLARNEEMFFHLKNLFIDNKIQFYIKNPSLALLNPDGSVNAGSELALSLFSTMSKQEMEEKKAKFKRTKHAYSKQGKYVGGHTIRLGYSVDANGYFVPNEEADIIKLAYELYSTGIYSFYSLALELTNRGCKRIGNLPINHNYINRILSTDAYTGAIQKDAHDRVFPQIVSVDLYNRCKAVRFKNVLTMKQKDGVQKIGSKILRCATCGAALTTNTRHYSCCLHLKKVSHYCPNGHTYRQDTLHKILWRVASQLYMDYLINMTEEKMDDYKNQLTVIAKKISTLTEKLNGITTKKQRVTDSYIEGLLTKENRDIKLSAIDKDTTSIKKEITLLSEQKSNIEALLNENKGVNPEQMIYAVLEMYEADKDNKKRMSEITHQFLTKAIPYPTTMEYEGKTWDVIQVDITTINGGTFKFRYFPKGNNKDILMVWTGKDWLEDLMD